MSAVYKSKAAATWLALALGSLGVHRLYLRGFGDRLAWLHAAPTLVGLYGVQRMDQLGQDDRLAWLLIPFLGAMLVQGMIHGIVYGLTPDERWNARWNPGQPERASGWAAVIGVVCCVFLGGIVLMSTIAFSAQRYFESQV
ncbi:NINE protein [Pelomonas sp. KK5]|uniref:NINE protein n=1 Tax=Pelomonas sp. KK5 TaxID=1855730 RepID=UPI00097BE530|nr:NINE protein [Pelomonas sp. KK5]